MPLPSPLPFTTPQFTILIDDREKRPYTFPGFKTKTVRLLTGDYTIPGLQRFVSVERKTLHDLIDCFHHARMHLRSQVDRLLAIPHHLFVIEASPLDFERGNWPHRDQVPPEFVEETLLHWKFLGLRVHLAGTRQRANRHVQQFLASAAHHYYQTYTPFFEALNAPTGQRQSALPSPNRGVVINPNRGDLKVA